MKKTIFEIVVYCIIAICLILGGIDISIHVFSHPAPNPTAQNLDVLIVIMVDVLCVSAVIALIGIYRTVGDIKKLLEKLPGKFQGNESCMYDSFFYKRKKGH